MQCVGKIGPISDQERAVNCQSWSARFLEIFGKIAGKFASLGRGGKISRHNLANLALVLSRRGGGRNLEIL